MHKTLSIGHSTNRPRELRGPNTLDWALADATAKPMQLVLLLHKRKGIVRLVGLQRTRWAWWRNDTIITAIYRRTSITLRYSTYGWVFHSLSRL